MLSRRYLVLIRVKNILTYLIPFIILLVAAISNLTTSEHNHFEEHANIQQNDVAYYSIDVPDASSTLYIPPSTSGACATHLFSNTKNRNYSPNFLSDFIKNGKLIRTTNFFFTQHNALTSLHSFTKPTFRLVSYGKLVI